MNNDIASARIGPPPVESMSPAQKEFYDRIANGPYGPYGPRMVLLHDTPVLNEWWKLGTAVAADLPARYRELAILVVARVWRSPFAWHAHEPSALKAGLSADTIEAIRRGGAPHFDQSGDKIIYDYTCELVGDRTVRDATYAAARELLGDAMLVRMTAFVGHYTNVCMTLVAHQVPLPPDAKSALSGHNGSASRGAVNS